MELTSSGRGSRTIKAWSRNLDGDFSEAKRHQQERHKDLIEMCKGPLDEMKKNAEIQRVERELNFWSAVRAWLSVANPWENHKSAKDRRRMPLGKWLANELEFRNWQKSEQSPMPVLATVEIVGLRSQTTPTTGFEI